MIGFLRRHLHCKLTLLPSSLGCIYEFGCELIICDNMPFGFIILFNLQKNLKKEKIRKNFWNRKKNNKRQNKRKSLCMNNGIVNSFPINCREWFVVRVSVLVLFLFLWFIVGCSSVFFGISFAFPNHLSTSSPFTFKPTLQPKKSLLIVMCTLHSRGRKLENLKKPMVVRIIGISIEWTTLYFKHMSGSDLHFPNMRFYQSIWLYSFPCAWILCFVVLSGQLSSISGLWSYIFLKAFTFS